VVNKCSCSAATHCNVSTHHFQIRSVRIVKNCCQNNMVHIASCVIAVTRPRTCVRYVRHACQHQNDSDAINTQHDSKTRKSYGSNLSLLQSAKLDNIPKSDMTIVEPARLQKRNCVIDRWTVQHSATHNSWHLKTPSSTLQKTLRPRFMGDFNFEDLEQARLKAQHLQ